MSLRDVVSFVPYAKALGVSEVARGRGGFIAAYKAAGGDPMRLSEHWQRKRDGFVKRHVAQMRAHGEPAFVDGAPTRRALALICWAYFPSR